MIRFDAGRYRDEGKLPEVWVIAPQELKVGDKVGDGQKSSGIDGSEVEEVSFGVSEEGEKLLDGIYFIGVVGKHLLGKIIEIKQKRQKIKV